MNLIESLIMDHNAIRALLKPLKSENSSEIEKRASFKHLVDLVKLHSKAEEIAVYVASKEQGDEELRDFALEGFEEHAIADVLIEKMKHTKDYRTWQAQARVLCELLEHHMVEEEEEYFLRVVESFSSAQLEKAGQLYFEYRGFGKKI